MSSPAEALPSGPEYSGDTLLIFTGVFIPVLVVCVALRVLARHLVKSPFGVDDVLVFASLVFQLGMAGIAISEHSSTLQPTISVSPASSNILFFF